MAITNHVLLLRVLPSAALSWALAGWLSRSLAVWGLLDQPNARGSHHRPTPRGGGVAFIVASLLLMPWQSSGVSTLVAGLLLFPLPLALVSLADDRWNLPVLLRLFVQLATAAALAWQAGWSLPLLLVTALPATAVINAINFMDGLDGLVASSLAVWLTLAALLLQLPALLLLAAALLGFLLWNWCPARLFMGDVGSTYLGAVMAGVLLQAARQGWSGAALGPLLLAALPLLADAASCLGRRLWAGQPLWQAHRLHLYQRLQQAGWSHRRVAALYALTTATLALLGLVVVTLGAGSLTLLGALVLVGLAVVTLALGSDLERRWAVPFGVALQASPSG